MARSVMRPPLVSILLPCFNAERFVVSAVTSLFSQTYRNIEVVAVDDGSTDSTPDKLTELAEHDDRLHIYRHPSNRGLIAALNTAIDRANGKLMARLDADDVAAPVRIQRAVDFLQSHPDISVVGSGAIYVASATGRRLRPRPVRCVLPAGTRFMGIFATPLAHPSIVARSQAMRETRYADPALAQHAEDYEMLARMLEAGRHLANIPENLVMIRVDPCGVSLSNEREQIESFVRCSASHLSKVYAIELDPDSHRVLVNRIPQRASPEALERGLALLSQLERCALIEARTPADRVDIRRVADMQRVDILLQAARRGDARLKMAAARLAAASRSLIRNPSIRGYLGTKIRPSYARRVR